MLSTSLKNVTNNDCPICSSSKSEILLSLKPRYEVKSSLGVTSTARIIYKCNDCGAFFPDDSSLVKDHQIDEMYDEKYHDSLTGSVKNENQSGVNEQNALRIALLNQFASEGDLLDIGCNTGHFLDSAQNAGYNVYGLEPSDFASRLAMERFENGEKRIEKATVTESEMLGARKYDVITLWDVIEHFYTLKEDLKCITDALKKDSILVLRTPDNASIFFQLAIFAHKMSFGRIDYPAISIFHNDHNFFFSEKSLKMLLSEMGFSVLKIAPDPLTWKKFRFCELNGRNLILKIAIGSLYWLSRLAGGGHGVLVVAKKL